MSEQDETSSRLIDLFLQRGYSVEMWITLFVGLLLPIVVWGGACPWKVPSDLLISDLTSLETKAAKLSVDQAREDLDCLREIFQKQYVAVPHFLKQGIDLSQRLDTLGKAISEPMDRKALAEKLLSLHQDAFDSHLMYSIQTKTERWNAFLPSRDLYFISGKAKGRKIRMCWGLHKVKALSESGQGYSAAFVGQFPRESAPETVTCETRTGKKIEIPLERKAPDVLPKSAASFSSKALPSDILYVRIPRFSAEITQEIEKIIPFFSNPANEHPVIFDLRQNPGGSDVAIHKLAAVFRRAREKGPRVAFSDQESLLSSASQTNAAFMSWEWARASGKPEDPFKVRYENFLEIFQNSIASGKTLTDFEIRRHTSSGAPGLRKGTYRKPIVLLTDKGCASACEGMLLEFRSLPNVTIMGTHSSGAVHYGNQGTMMLPHSGILVMTGSREIDFPEFPIDEGTGIAPDYYVLHGNTLATAINYIRLVAVL